MHTFESKNLLVNVNSDGSGDATLHLGATFDPGVHEIPAEELVRFARWLLNLTGPQAIERLRTDRGRRVNRPLEVREHWGDPEQVTGHTNLHDRDGP